MSPSTAAPPEPGADQESMSVEDVPVAPKAKLAKMTLETGPDLAPCAYSSPGNFLAAVITKASELASLEWGS